MAEELTTSSSTAAARLREAAKLTMRRKQAPGIKPITANGASNSVPDPPPVALPDTFPITRSPLKGPRGIASLTASDSTPLDYGNPTDLQTKAQKTASPSLQSTPPGKPPMAGSISRQTRAAKAAANHRKGLSKEEGEISDEEARARREGSSQDRENTTIRASVVQLSVAGSNKDETTLQDRINPAASASKGPDLVEPKKQASTSAVAPRPRRATVHREPPPISPAGATPPGHVFSERCSSISLKDRIAPASEPLPRRSSPTSFLGSTSKPAKEIPTLDFNDNIPNFFEHGSESLSPATSQRNAEVFSVLASIGVDEDHCRPGLPMTFQQFEAAKALILDLLGLGLSPENLVDTRIDRRLLVYCLRELKIRLPANVPVDDIVIFEPPTALSTNGVDSVPLSSPVLSSREQEIEDSPIAMEITPTDALPLEEPRIVPTLAKREDPPHSKLAVPVIGLPERPSVEIQSLATKLNINAKPFLPNKPSAGTTGPSLHAMALSTQQIPALPQRDGVSPPLTHSLPARPSRTAAPTLRRQSTSNNSISEIVEAPLTDSQMEPNPEQSADPPDLQALEREKKLILLRQQLKMKRRGLPSARQQYTSTPPVETPPVETPPETMLDSEHVDSPASMDVDLMNTDDANVSQQAPTPPVDPTLVMPKRPPVRLRATLARAISTREQTRPTTPLDSGPKRGVKRPKADDFVEDLPAKRSIKANGVASSLPTRQFSFASLNASAPDSLVIDWVDDDDLEHAEPEPWTQMRSKLPNDLEAAHLAAAALALGLPMSAEELEAARMQEEDRKAQIVAKEAKLLQVQATLKRLELKKAEKKLHHLQSLSHDEQKPEEASVLENAMQIMKQELGSLSARLLETQSANVSQTMEVSASTLPALTPNVSTGSAASKQEPSNPADWDGEANDVSNLLLASENENEQMQENDGLNAEDTPSNNTERSPNLSHAQPPPAVYEPLREDLASQSRFRAYSPPLILSALAHRHSSLSQTSKSTNGAYDISEPTNLTASVPQPPNSRPLVDPNRSLCQFESLGGDCRDPNCEDLHFRDFDQGLSTAGTAQ